MSRGSWRRATGEKVRASRARYGLALSIVDGKAPHNGAGLAADQDFTTNRRLRPIVPFLLADQGKGIPAIAAAIIKPRGHRSVGLSTDVRRARDGGGAGRLDRCFLGSDSGCVAEMGTRLTLSRMAMSGRAMSNPGIGRERSMRMDPLTV